MAAIPKDSILVGLLTIKIFGPPRDTYETDKEFDARNQLAIKNVSNNLPRIEDEINDHLPGGYHATLYK